MFSIERRGFTGASEVDFALKRGGRVLLGDEMGLGKTAQARMGRIGGADGGCGWGKKESY